MRKKILTKLTIGVLLLCTTTGGTFAATPKLADLSSQYLNGDLESLQSIDTIKKIDFSDMIFTNVPDEKYEMFRCVLNNEKYPDMALSARRIDASNIADDRQEMNLQVNDVIKNGITHSASDYKANEITFQFDRGTTQKMLIYAINKERRVVAYGAFFNDQGKIVSDENYILPQRSLKKFDVSALTFQFESSDNSYTYKVNRDKLDSELKAFTYVRGSGYGSGIISEKELNRLVVSSLKFNGVARPYSDDVIQGIDVRDASIGPTHKDFNKPYSYVFALYDAQKNPMAYTMVVFEGYEVKPLSSYNITDRADYKTFSTSALTVVPNSKNKAYSIKIDKAKLPKEMQKFSKFVLSATSKNNFYGINKSFSAERIASSKKYNYQEKVGLSANIDGKTIFCLQLFDEKDNLLGYVVFK